MADKKLTWNPTKEQKENLKHDMDAIDSMYEYRSQFEAQWLKSARKWNQVASVVDSFFVPVTRMATYTGVVATRQALPKIGLVMEDPDDYGKEDNIRDANDHVDRQCGMEEVMDNATVDLAVLGNAILEDFVEYRYRTIRNRKLDKNGKWTGSWTTTYERDLSKPKIGTRARSPWECAFEPGTRTITDIRSCTFQDVLTYPEFQEIYHHGKTDIYINTEHVEGGAVWIFDSEKEEFRFENKKDNRVVIQHFQDERTDTYRIYANGILIQDESLRDFHVHGKITLSLLTKHHKYDQSMKHAALYGAGDPEIMEELDEIIQAMTNQFIKNYELKNTYVVGVEGSASLKDIDVLSGDVIPGRINIQNLGSADLNEFLEFKNAIEEWIIQLVKKNYKRLEGEVAQTAYEARQKQASENMGMLYEIKRLENVGLKAHYMKRVSDIMEFMTEEELIDISDQTAEEIMKQPKGKIDKKELVFHKGKPVQIRYRERFKTKGRVYDMKMINGKPHTDGLRQRFELDGQDGVLVAHPEYLWTREYLMYKTVPDVYVVGATVLGQDKDDQLARLEALKQSGFEMVQFTQGEVKPDFRKIYEKQIDLSDMKREDVLGTGAENSEVDEKEQISNNILDVLQQSKTTDPSQASIGRDLGQSPEVAPNPLGATTGGM